MSLTYSIVSINRCRPSRYILWIREQLLQPLICHIIFSQLSSFYLISFNFIYLYFIVSQPLAVNSAPSSRFIISLLFPATLTPGMWSQMFQLPPKMAQSRSPDSADAPDSETAAAVVVACMIYCFKGRPTPIAPTPAL